MQPQIRVAHIITDLDVGGAERMLHRLVGAQDRGRFASQVFCLSPGGALAPQIRALDLPVVQPSMGGILGLAEAAFRLGAAVKAFRPDVVQTWLYHADLFGVLVRQMHGVKRLCWNIRCAEVGPGDVSATTRLMIRILARLSRVPDVVIFNSVAGRAAHEALGYRPRAWRVLHNGFDTARFRPDPAARAEVRASLGVGDAVSLVGLIARVEPIKDHANFLIAAARVSATLPSARFVLAGRGTTVGGQSLHEAIAAYGLAGKVLALGERLDVERINAALDVAVSSSYSEGMPNAVGEAMACGVPCVVTDAGDSGELVGDAGVVVPTRNPEALAAGILRLLEMQSDERARLGARARARIEQSFSLSAVVNNYSTVYEGLTRQS